MIYRRHGKRLLDLTASALLLVLSSPVVALAMLAVRLTSPGPIFFVQRRLGRDGRIFPIFKLRTMTDRAREVAGEVTAEHPEVTAVGRLLRRTHIDELPQLLNVIRGEMSLIGPRPTIPEHLERFDDFGRRRMAVRPGLTGLAQVYGNIHLSWPERWRYDVEYVERLSLPLDLKIAWCTVVVLLMGNDRYLDRPAPGAAPDGSADDRSPEREAEQ